MGQRISARRETGPRHNRASTYVILEDMKARTMSRSKSDVITARYHRLPTKLADDYKLDRHVLGAGVSGQVHLATSVRDSSQRFAVKSVNLYGMSHDERVDLATEAEIFLGMDHPHVARLVDVYEENDRLHLVMECMEGGELSDRVAKLKRFSERDAAEAVWQMLLAINYLHSKGIVHRDIKLENFLYEAKDTDHLKLIDFGFSKIWSPDTKMVVSCGTLSYVAPEVLKKQYTDKCDLWSLGVIVFVLLFGHLPFRGTEQRQMTDIMAGKYFVNEDVRKQVSPPAWDFTQRLLTLDPDTRPSAEEALEHTWIVKRSTARTDSHPSTVAELAGFAKVSQVRRVGLKMVALSMPDREKASLRDAFLRFDTNRDGTITLQELKAVLREHGGLDGMAEETLKALSHDDQGEIQYSEFLAAMVSTRVELTDALIEEAFRRFDADRSGYITDENLQEIFGVGYQELELAQFMQEADTSGDGRISLQEFMAFMKSAQEDARCYTAQAEEREKRSAEAPQLWMPEITPRGRSTCCGLKQISTRAKQFSARTWGTHSEDGRAHRACDCCVQ